MAAVKAKFAGSRTLIHTHCQKGDDTIVVRADDILDVMEFLRNGAGLSFDMILDVTAVDYLNDMGIWPYMAELGARFEVVYHLYSVDKNHRIRVKSPLPADKPHINSVTSIWPGADWFEREAWDLYGVVFRGHPNLKRILLYEAFVGHPLRKDYPKTKRQPLIGPVN
ncbi:MAG: NADH-quinone oxidoreductase subunit C [Nitrospinae bacterium]|nr:NADH-quinone oxidoreductase subunit C [Nitrospinota bacterium]